MSLFETGSSKEGCLAVGLDPHRHGIRTALALIAAGVALEAFALPIEPTFRLTAAIVLIGLSVLAPMQAWLGWMSTERALRLEKPLPAPHLAGPIGVGVVAAGLLLVVGLLLP